MIYRYPINSFGKINVWINEFPDTVFTPDRFIEHAFPTQNIVHGVDQKAAVEVFMNFGPLGVYGLLGGYFITERSGGDIRMALGILEQKQKLYHDSIAFKSDTITVGFPEEFSSSVLQAAAPELQNLPPGKLTLNCAASGLVGSNQLAFMTATQLLIRILAIPAEQLSEEVIRSVVQSIRVSF